MNLKPTKKADQNPSAPGSLRSQVVMELQTGLAQRLVHGRERQDDTAPILGVLGFGHRAALLWRSAAQDDPYADWFLLKIAASIDATKQKIDEQTKRIGDVLVAMEGFKIEIAHALEPVEFPIQFSNPYGYMGAYLVADFDGLSRAVLTARHLGLIDRLRSDEILRGAGRAIRRTFNYALEWRLTGVRRKDFEPMNANAERAQKLMGEIPSEILKGTHRARIAPPINPDHGSGPAGSQETSNTNPPDNDAADPEDRNISPEPNPRKTLKLTKKETK